VYPRTLNEVFIAVLIWSAVFVKRSPVPYYASLFMTYMLAIFLNFHRTFVFPFARRVATNVLERTIEVDSELELQRRCAEFIAWGFEVTLKVFLAFSRTEAWAPPGTSTGAGLSNVFSPLSSQPVVVIAPPAPTFPSLPGLIRRKTPAPSYEQAVYDTSSQFMEPGTPRSGYFSGSASSSGYSSPVP
jgi:hypothetical protein